MDQYIQAIAALLAIANPLAAVPVFLEAVDGADKKQRRNSASLAAVSVFAILLVAAVAGNWVLDIFDVSLSAFRCGGGLVILLMGLTMLQGRTSRVQKESLTHNDRLTTIFVPLAMPLIAGPGAITTVITIALAEPYWKNLSVALTAIVVLASVLWVMLLLSQSVHGVLGPLGQKVLLRFFGLILVAIGMQFMLAGAHEFFSSVGRPQTAPVQTTLDHRTHERPRIDIDLLVPLGPIHAVGTPQKVQASTIHDGPTHPSPR